VIAVGLPLPATEPLLSLAEIQQHVEPRHLGGTGLMYVYGRNPASIVCGVSAYTLP